MEETIDMLLAKLEDGRGICSKKVFEEIEKTLNQNPDLRSEYEGLIKQYKAEYPI